MCPRHTAAFETMQMPMWSAETKLSVSLKEYESRLMFGNDLMVGLFSVPLSLT